MRLFDIDDCDQQMIISLISLLIPMIIIFIFLLITSLIDHSFHQALTVVEFRHGKQYYSQLFDDEQDLFS